MFLGKPVLAIAVAALCLGGGAVSASAQQSCAGYYNQVMNAYQTLGPSSPQYTQMANDYSARCLSGAAAAPNPGYQAPYYQPAPYGYAQPAPIDPAAALVGAAIVGGVVAGALDNNNNGILRSRRITIAAGSSALVAFRRLKTIGHPSGWPIIERAALTAGGAALRGG